MLFFNKRYNLNDEITHLSFSQTAEYFKNRFGLTESIEETKNYTGLTVNLAINYGGRDEIIRGIKKIIDKGYKSEEISEELKLALTSFIDYVIERNK